MPPLGRDWYSGQTKEHREEYPNYVAKKIGIWKNDKKVAQSLIKHSMCI